MVSVVMPVYNAGKYLGRAISSMLQQTFHDFELILVDDGSTDDSWEICKKYASEDNRIKVFHQNNGGVSAARLKGFMEMKGEYFISYDPDDWMEPNYLEELWQTAVSTDADIVYCDYDMVWSDKVVKVQYPLSPLDTVTYLKAQMVGGMWGVYWNKLIRTSIMRQHHIKPIVGITIWDDFVVVNSCALYAKKIVYCDKILYHYNQQNVNSVTKKNDENKYLDVIGVVKAFEKEVQKAGFRTALNDAMIQLKIIAKSYLLIPPYRNFESWRNVFPESNVHAIEYARDKEERQILELVLEHKDKMALALSCYYRYKEKIVRHIKKDIICKLQY